MPKIEPISADEKENIGRSIKKELAEVGSSVSEAARRLNNEYKSSEVPSNLLRQINNGTIPHWKVLRIAKVHNLKLVWQKNDFPT